MGQCDILQKMDNQIDAAKTRRFLWGTLLAWIPFLFFMFPTMIGLFFLGSVQLIALGIIGEYVGSIHTIVQGRPLVTEKERINF